MALAESVNMPFLKLTKGEVHILEDRLKLEDCIIEVLTDDIEDADEKDLQSDRILRVIGKINHICRNNCDFDFRMLTDPELDIAKLILEDCVTSNTMYFTHNDYHSCKTNPGRLAAIVRCGNSLAVKIGQLINKTIEFQQ